VKWAAAALLGALAAAVATAAPADGLAQLKAFHATTKSGKVTFRQAVAAKGRQDIRESTGTFSFQRPGRFRWTYETPYEQLIVGDGDRLWIYDRDLNQVIVRRLDRALGASPAAILAGSNALDANFILSDAGQADGLEYVEAQPRTPDTGFEHIRIGFRDNQPRAMELADAFGNVTQLTFAAFERNAPVDAALFRFVPPKGADVVGE
jgi:outer membrane lipoprotein carrier protein